MALDIFSYALGVQSGGGSGGGGIKGGHTVTFKVDDDDYYISSCKDGEKISAPPNPVTPPTISGNFTGWQLNENYITFPYTPNKDIELTAVFSVIPTGYTLLNYIQTTGTQYIDTGITPSTYNGFGIKIKTLTPIQYQPASADYGNCIFGASTRETDGSQGSMVGISREGQMNLGVVNTTTLFSPATSFNNTYELEAAFSKDFNSYAKINNELVAEKDVRNSYTGGSRHLHIMGYSMGSPYTFPFPCNARFGETIITTPPVTARTLDGTTELRHFLPCLDTNLEPCMYDTVTETTFYNSGSDIFLYG